jgi:uncharacterized membrane protein YeaQ/YmgE (transglycosylase-associated protein family)
MSLFGLIILLIVAAVAGSVGQALVGFSRGGCLVSIFVGFIGAYLGTWLARTFGLPTFLVLNIDGQPFPLVWAVIGAALLSLVLSLITRRRVYY